MMLTPYKTFFAILACLSLFSCSSASIDDYDQTTPKLNLVTFFDGELTAAGIVQDFSGKVTRKFTVTMTGEWQDSPEGKKGVLKEWFVYDDGEKQTRIWYLTDLGNGQYEGRADDILGVAEGQANGSALRWRYDMKLPVEGSEYEVEFDDWMFLVDENTIINKSDIIKFGVTVAQVTLVIQKS
ncbi:DUF3833 domain-containing protein [Shewanella gaetbuli]|uniref:DUF3833 domain-containing protein n=1 Tax=Shewanella gaetbuli TaxID=220752 RepID=A0A9X2CFD9_9GAMM|nr:DUF3833 domain-containing protein [Shewanella gaetbuli]MCL1141303.1 DUF3833 domain-containing protein [Shewanella gaetbuli]